MRRWLLCCWVAAGVCVQLAGGAGAAAPAAGPANSAARRLTIQELMDTRIDPAADVLWDSVAFIASERGEEDRRPRTREQWNAVRASALALIEAVGELRAPGRRVSSLEKDPGPGELGASDIQRLIDAHHGAFVRLTRPLEAAARKALAAIDAKNADALMNAGGLIDEACEACHVIYWYPHQAQPHR